MWWRKKPTTQWVRIEDLDQLRDALARLDARLVAVEEEEGLRRLSIEDWYEKFRALYARLNKRVERAENAEASAPEKRPVNPAALKILGGML